MSIRLRLALLYTGILALTLIVFSSVLYGIQYRNVIGRQERSLVFMASNIKGLDLPAPPRWEPVPGDAPRRPEAIGLWQGYVDVCAGRLHRRAPRDDRALRR